MGIRQRLSGHPYTKPDWETSMDSRTNADYPHDDPGHTQNKRPGLDKLLLGVARKDFDLVAAWSVDRLGRSLQDLISILGEVHAKDVGLYLHQQGLDTTTPAGEAMFQMLGVFAQFERAMIRERVNAGLARARAQGKKLGRPKVAPAVERRVRASLGKGTGILKTARSLGLGTRTVQRIKDEMLGGAA
jgi:DNA invertase Pin-like site-specific DNA recombinase